ncbi:hypothetical protein C882_0775 [Caenispirillum salinarum AK4]|uniref:Dolichol-P-glucose synthetase n=1 Tax=Caenispirillum salinarum AK4 TaxID=1238182 RepID=K9GV05_9PROT|nr:lysylphosphatidylglycerol synthase transmembrane domain-containing protein [Caenispirillum salinarum]EKV28564.1 hypothetical protein C882_0775 [Caenispirillum salinarum AK4]
MDKGRKRALGALRLTATVAVLGTVAYFLDTRAIIDKLAGVRPEWLVAALAAALPHYVFSALRWRYMTRQFGGDLSLNRAVPEYFLAVLLNQTLPGGVPGDLVRAWRDKGRASGNGNGNGNGNSNGNDNGAANGNGRNSGLGRHTEGLGAAARGVLFERASGQITLVLVAIVGVLTLPGTIRDTLPLWAFALVPLGLAVVVAASMLVLRRLDAGARTGDKPGRVLQFLRDGRWVLFGPRHFLMHVLYSLPVVASFLGTFYLAGKAIGITLDPVLAVSAVPIVLLSMTVPITVGGWGVREGAAAALWAVVGLPASEGVAISVLYGVVILLSASPGALVLLRR